MIKTLLLCLILTGCASSNFTADQDRFKIELILLDAKTIEKQCGKGKNGCNWVLGDTYYVYSTKNWCVINHEIAHVIKGNYHKGIKATCDALPKNENIK